MTLETGWSREKSCLPSLTNCVRAYSATQWGPTLCNPMDYSLPGSSVCGILQARILKEVAIPFSRNLPDPGIELASPASPVSAGRFFTTEPPGSPTSCVALGK